MELVNSVKNPRAVVTDVKKVARPTSRKALSMASQWETSLRRSS